jgi:predicted PurR-regulated permease PerM
MSKLSENKVIKFEITTKSLFIVLGFVAGIFLILKLGEVLFVVLLSFIITSSLRPYVDALHDRKVPRVVTILAIYALVVLVIGAFAYILLNSLTPQISFLVQNFPSIFAEFVGRVLKIFPWVESLISTEQLIENVKNAFSETRISPDEIYLSFDSAFGFLSSAFEIFVAVVTTVILSVYMLMRRERVLDQIALVLPSDTRGKFLNLVPKIEVQLGSWLRAQLALIFLMGTLSWIGLTVIGIKFALPVAILIGLLEIVPNIGPTFGWMIATIVAIGSGASLLQVVLVIAWSVFIHQLEHYVFVPKIFQKAVGLDPLITILGILSASILFGLPGVLVAVPLLAIAQITIKDLSESS